MSAYALDANILSYLLKRDLRVSRRVSEEAKNGNMIVIPPIAYYEVRRGLLAVKSTVKLRVFEMLCKENKVGVIDVDVLNEAAEIYADLRCAGKPIDDADLLIAAFCIVGDYILVTNNTRHFERIEGLQVVNWTE